MDLSIYIPKPPVDAEEQAHWDKNMDLVMKVVTTEDFPIGRTIQQGIRAGAQTHTVFGRNEPAMIHYHQSLHRALNEPRGGELRTAAE